MNRERLLHVLNHMRRFGTLGFAFVAFALVALAARPASGRGFRVPDPNVAPLTEHQMQLRDANSPRQPYATTFADEAARRLGVENGNWEAFSTHSRDPLTPSFRGGIDNGKAMIGLQWRFGS